MKTNRGKSLVKTEEVKKWTGDIVHAAKDTISEVIENVKEKSDNHKKKQDDARYQKDLLLLKPVFIGTYSDTPLPDGSVRKSKAKIPAIIHVAEPDKKHAESKACENSIGYLSEENGITVLNIYNQNMQEIGVNFYPDNEQSIYYVDPVQKGLYIDISEYFQHLKTARVNELEQLAYSLGASYFRILFKTNTSETETMKKKAGISIKKGRQGKADIGAENSGSETSKESIEIVKELYLSGHNDPQIPKLVYFKDDPDITSLVFMRMDPKNQLKRKECVIKYSRFSGIKESNAAKVQGALDSINGGASISILNETKVETNTTLIYTIEF